MCCKIGFFFTWLTAVLKQDGIWLKVLLAVDIRSPFY